jgi:hypothetical protein
MINGKDAYLIRSFSSAAITIGEKGCSSIDLVPVSNFVSQLAIGLLNLLTAGQRNKNHIGFTIKNYNALFLSLLQKYIIKRTEDKSTKRPT